MAGPGLWLLAPGLAGPRLALRDRSWLEGLDPGPLGRWLARGQPLPPPGPGGPHGGDPAAGTEEGLLAHLFGLPDQAVPWGPLARRAEGLAPDGRWWLRGAALELRPEGPRVVVGRRIPALSPAEGVALAQDLIPLLEEEGLGLALSPAGRWHLATAEDPGLRAPPPSALLGRPLDPGLLPGGRWRRLLTEAQMLLHGHPVNREREARGLPPANALWLWGAGRELPLCPGPPPFRALWGGGEAAQGLAGWARIPWRPLPEGALAWLEAARQAPAEGGPHLAVVGETALPAALGEVEAWREALESVVEAWLAPLDRLLREGVVGTVVLLHERGGLRLERRGLGRWWRRPRPFPGPWGEAP